jgi:hypothetical protein
MRIVEEVTLFDQLTDPKQIASADADLAEIRLVIPTIHWPPGSDSFTINPKRKGNGVVPIKKAFALDLKARDWTMEIPLFGRRGGFDAGRPLDGAWSTLVEWETGNISSSHRSLNRLTIALIRGLAHQAVLFLAAVILGGYILVGIWELVLGAWLIRAGLRQREGVSATP